MKQHHLDIKDIDAVFGTHLQQSMQDVQTTIDAVQPKVKFINDNWIGLVVAFVLLLVVTTVIGNLITD